MYAVGVLGMFGVAAVGVLGMFGVAAVRRVFSNSIRNAGTVDV